VFSFSDKVLGYLVGESLASVFRVHSQSFHPASFAILDEPQVADGHNVTVDLNAVEVAILILQPLIGNAKQVVMPIPDAPRYFHYVVAV
jgi:hypothetical protein